jgi:hypothetical protein
MLETKPAAATLRTERETVQIPRAEANWRVVVRLRPVVMPIARSLAASRARTEQLPCFGGDEVR